MRDGSEGRRKKNRKGRNSLGNRMALVGITVVIAALAIVVNIGNASLRKKSREYTAREQELSAAVAEEESRAEQLEEYRIYVQTKQYVEKVAQEKLGLVKKGEILFKPEEEK